MDMGFEMRIPNWHGILHVRTNATHIIVVSECLVIIITRISPTTNVLEPSYVWAPVHWGDQEGSGDPPQGVSGCHQMRGAIEKSAIAEHAWTEHHRLAWDDVTILI